jgi:cytochrome c oxidase subunit 2
VKKFWCGFFIFWPIVAVVLCLMAPSMGWWFPGAAMSPIGERIDGLFYLILIITSVTFVLTHIALGYVRSVVRDGGKALFTRHHNPK